MGLLETFHFQPECETCGSICHFAMNAKIPGSYMNNYWIGDRISDEVLDSLREEL